MAKLHGKWIIKDGRVFTTGSDGSLQLVLDTPGALEINAGGLNVRASGIVDDMILDRTIREEKLADTYIRADGQNPFEGNQSMDGNRLTNLGAPADAGDAVNMQYVRDVLNGIDRKASVRAATVPTEDNVLGDYVAGFVMDGIPLVAGNRILVKNLADDAQNGIYVVGTSGEPVRATDADGSDLGEISTGMTTFVEAGATNRSTTWSVISIGTKPNSVIDVGTDGIVFTQTGEPGELLAGDGLRKDGLVFSVAVGAGLFAGPGVLTLAVDFTQLAATAERGLHILGGAITKTELSSLAFGSGIQGGDGYVVELGELYKDWNVGSSFAITGLKAPVADGDAVNKKYVDDLFLATAATKTAVITLTPADIAAKQTEIGEGKPAIANVTMFVQGGIPQLVGTDFIVTAGINGPASAINWDGLFLATVLEAGDTISVQWNA